MKQQRKKIVSLKEKMQGLFYFHIVIIVIILLLSLLLFVYFFFGAFHLVSLILSVRTDVFLFSMSLQSRLKKVRIWLLKYLTFLLFVK